MSKNEKEVLFARIPPKLMENLKKEAAKRGLSVNTLVILLLEELYG